MTFAEWAKKQGFTADDLNGPLHELEGCWRAAQAAAVPKEQESLSAELGGRGLNMKRTIEHSPKNSEFMEVVMIDKIVYLSKAPDGETTLIHLTTGAVLVSRDSMKTIQARIDAA